MECFVIYLKDIKGRIDPHYYSSNYRLLDKGLSGTKHRPLGELVNFSNETWNQTNLYETTFPYVEINDIDITTGCIGNITYYETAHAPSRARMIVREGDIILSTTRPHRGAIALIDKTKDGFIASTGFAILRELKSESISKEYLFHVLRMSLCLQQMIQHSSGGNYPAITIEELKKVLIPIPDFSTQRTVVSVMQSAYQLKRQKEAEAQSLLDSIDEYVLGELGIRLPKLENKAVFNVSSGELEMRIDPHYYQPKFKYLYEAIQSYGDVYRLQDIVEELDYGLMPMQDYAIGEDEGVPMVRVTNILKDGTIDLNDIKYIPFGTVKLDSKRLKKDDILMVQCGSTTGKVALVPKQCEDYTFGSFSFLIRGKQNIADQRYLFAVLANTLSQEQIKRTWNIVTVRPNTSKPSIGNVLIPLPDMETQRIIGNEVQSRINNAVQLRSEAITEVEKAKAEVERLILDNERTSSSDI